MSILLHSSRLAHCYTDPKSNWVAVTKWVLSNATREMPNFWARKRKDGPIDTHTNTRGRNSIATYLIVCGVEGKPPEKWYNSLLKKYQELQLVVHDCDQCKHKLACMVVPHAVRTFEEK